MRATAAVMLLALPQACAAPEPGPESAPDVPAAQLFDQAEFLFRAREYGRALEAYQLVAHEAERQGDRRTTVEACAMVARCYSIARDLAKGQMWLERAGERADVAEPHGWSRTQLVRGIFQRERGDREAALGTFEQLYTYCGEAHLYSQAIDAAHHAAIVAPLEGQVVWSHEGLAAARAAGDERWQAILWNNLGGALEALGRHEEMLHAYRQARVFHGRTGGDREILIADWALGRALRLVGRADAAEALLADVLTRAELRQAADPGPANLEWVGYINWELGEVRAMKGERGLALRHLTRALEVLEQAGVQEVWPEGMAELLARAKEFQ